MIKEGTQKPVWNGLGCGRVVLVEQDGRGAMHEIVGIDYPLRQGPILQSLN